MCLIFYLGCQIVNGPELKPVKISAKLVVIISLQSWTAMSLLLFDFLVLIFFISLIKNRRWHHRYVTINMASGICNFESFSYDKVLFKFERLKQGLTVSLGTEFQNDKKNHRIKSKFSLFFMPSDNRTCLFINLEPLKVKNVKKILCTVFKLILK